MKSVQNHFARFSVASQILLELKEIYPKVVFINFVKIYRPQNLSEKFNTALNNICFRFFRQPNLGGRMMCNCVPVQISREFVGNFRGHFYEDLTKNIATKISTIFHGMIYWLFYLRSDKDSRRKMF